MKVPIREKINKDDGKYFQIENRDLKLKEIVGYAFLVLAMLIYLIVDKLGFQQSWLGWIFLFIGIILVALGVIKSEQQ